MRAVRQAFYTGRIMEREGPVCALGVSCQATCPSCMSTPHHSHVETRGDGAAAASSDIAVTMLRNLETSTESHAEHKTLHPGRDESLLSACSSDLVM